MPRKRRLEWKEFYIASAESRHRLGVINFKAAFGPDVKVAWEDGASIMITNAPLTSLKRIAARQGVKLPDCVWLNDDDEAVVKFFGEQG
jgi:hypothetical protein